MDNPFERLENKLESIEKLLLSMQHREQPIEPEQDKWFGIDELCKYLPDKPVISTIYGKVHLRKIPYHKQGKSLIFRKSEIDEWLGQGRVKTNSEIEVEAGTYLKRKK
ncbi:hypothetical protein A2W14_02905 [Candidatus Gottesmanbacteria bacterium RBG_16_37_8]|uniref:Helix-turn-helix domain-containing protein n=1 Tax=Candidatus Gottesmanbacteria bacterium RBG_16_37_8 TaxID=1798371 RepID=A0A1F5YTE4_9BACT|nr:MAG: hypothetical protein A2W14_02905 [Candidatus Gottesmanbacteria bacterium RBG_16_37_8]